MIPSSVYCIILLAKVCVVSLLGKLIVGTRHSVDLQNVCSFMSLPSLTSLSIVNEHINSDGAILLAEALASNRTITRVDLSQNHLLQGQSDGYDSNGGLRYSTSVEGVKAFASMYDKIEHCSRLT